jgi:hypothetical protein
LVVLEPARGVPKELFEVQVPGAAQLLHKDLKPHTHTQHPNTEHPVPITTKTYPQSERCSQEKFFIFFSTLHLATKIASLSKPWSRGRCCRGAPAGGGWGWTRGSPVRRKTPKCASRARTPAERINFEGRGGAERETCVIRKQA